MILLKHFDEVKYKEDRITCNLAKVIHVAFIYHSLIDEMSQVPQQQNGKDCGCFLIYFAKMFFSNPHSTMALIKVLQSFFCPMI